jgi:putative ABC transport system permease protein
VWNQDGVGSGGGSDVWLTVVGVVGDVRFSGLDDEAGLDVYAPHTQLFAGDSYLVVRSRMDPDALRSALRATIDRVDPDQSFFEVQTMTERMRGTLWQPRVASAVLTIFAGIALCLAVMGVYAVTAQSVASQRREIGLRLALGSSDTAVMGLVLHRWLLPVIVGVAAGSAAALAMARMIPRLTGLNAEGGVVPSAWLVVILVGAAVVACAVPVRRTLRRVNLTDALRQA